MILRGAYAEHPAIARGTAHTGADLVRECLERQSVMGGGQSAAKRIIGPVDRFLRQEQTHGFVEPPTEEPLYARIGHAPRQRKLGSRWQMEAVDRIEEEQRADARVQI